MEALVNKKAYFNYEILEKFEAGLKLTGGEVKSVKLGRLSFEGSYISIREGEAWWVNATIPSYQPKNAPAGYDPTQPRKLLLKKNELKYLFGRAEERGLTLLPLRIYNKHGRLKLEIGIARRRKKHDKREVLKKRAIEHDISRELRG